MAEGSNGGKALGVLAALALGATAGALTERRLAGRRFSADSPQMRRFAGLRGQPATVFAADGTRLHVEIDTPPDYDPRSTPTIVFSHGFALNQQVWYYQRKALRPFARLVFWDQRSHGRSGRGPTGTHEIDQLGYDLESVIAQVTDDAPLMLVGHSMGGMTVMSLAAAHPEIFDKRVVGVGLLGTSAAAINEVPLGLPKPLARIAHRLAPLVAPQLVRNSALIEGSRERVSDLSKLLTQRYSFASEVPPEVDQLVFDMINATPVDVIGEFLPTFDRHDKQEALSALQGREVLVMVGREDKMTPAGHSFEIVRSVPHAELVVLSETGHMLMVERPVQVNRELLELLERSRRALSAHEL